MRKCIICGKQKEENEFNIEHIIPEALGNKNLKTNNVCTDCNSMLGSKIDKYITSNFFMELVRYAYNVKSKNNSLPFPFKEGIDENGNKIRLDNKFKPTLIPTVSKKGNRYTIKASNEQEALKIIKKVCERKKLNIRQKNELINKITNCKIQEVKPSILFEFTINLDQIELAFLKIAYEYSCLKLGDFYYYDEYGSKIREVIQKALNNEKVEKYNMMQHLPNDNKLNELITYLGKQFNNSHFLQMQTINNTIVLTISLFCEISLSYTIIISNNASKYKNSDFMDFIKIN